MQRLAQAAAHPASEAASAAKALAQTAWQASAGKWLHACWQPVKLAAEAVKAATQLAWQFFN